MGDKTRRFVVDGQNLYFAKEQFKHCFKAHQTSSKLSANALEELIAEKVGVSSSTVHGWLRGQSGPANTDIIAGLADFFSFPEADFYIEEEQIIMGKLTEQQVQAVDRIYKEIINFLFIFLNTDGIFADSSVIYDLDIPYDKRHEYADSEFEKVKIAWYKEFVYLKGTSIYDELDDFIWNDLVGTYQDISDNIPGIDKLSGSYRYEPDEGKAAADDFDEAIVKLQKIICKYI